MRRVARVGRWRHRLQGLASELHGFVAKPPANPTSPTGAAVRDYTEQTGTEKKNIQVDSIMAQAGEDEANAAYMRKSASDALLSGDIGAGAGILGKNGLGGLPGLSGSLGSSSIGNPTQIGALY